VINLLGWQVDKYFSIQKYLNYTTRGPPLLKYNFVQHEKFSLI
jgi:hypothetical protein